MIIDKSAYRNCLSDGWKPRPAPVSPGTRAGQQVNTPRQVSDQQRVNTQHSVTTNHSVPTRAEIEQACAEFASIFLHTLIKSMDSTIPKSSLCPEFQGKKLVNSIIDQNMAQLMASQNGAGLKELLLREFQNHTNSK